MKDTTAIVTMACPVVEKAIQSNMASYKKYISTFINSRADALYSTMPSKQIYFTTEDSDNFFKSTKIDQAKIKNAISNTYYSSIASFNPRYAKTEYVIAMTCLIRYFKNKNLKKELDFALVNLAFSGQFYPSVWYGSFPYTPPQEHIMEYVINQVCTNKFDIVREGSVIGAVRSICNTWVNTPQYQSKFKEFHDDDVCYLIQQLHNRIKSFIINIAQLYYEAFENKDTYMTYDSDDVSDENYRLADSDSLRIERIVEAAMSDITKKGVDQRICKMASNDRVKVVELKSIIENVLANSDNMPLIKELASIMVSTYFQNSKTKDVKDLGFISFTIKAKPNTKDPHILRQKEILNILLINNAEHFNRRRNTAETEQSYYRAILAYFALVIQQAA